MNARRRRARRSRPRRKKRQQRRRPRRRNQPPKRQQLSSRAIVPSRNRLSTLLLEAGYNVFLPVFDEGIDLIAHRESDGDLKLIQQKGRWSILRKYMGRDIWLAFPSDNTWFLLPHDDMLLWPEVQGYLKTRSWLQKGEYHVAPLPEALRLRCAPFAV